MAKQSINVGTAANDKKGDSLRAAFVKVNANFTELYAALGLTDVTLNLGAFTFTGSVMSTDDSTNIVIDKPITVNGEITVDGDITPKTNLGASLGTPTKQFKSLYVSNSTIYIGGTAVGVDANGNLTTGGTVVGSSPAWANITGKPTFATVATTGAYADLTGKPTLFSGSYNDLTNKPNLAGTYQFSVAADDSTQRVISTDELVKFIGAGGITTASDAEGNITINYVQGDIRSEGNINIDINLSDSTLRRWQFGEDGALTFPEGYLKIVPNGANPYISNIIDNGVGLVSGSVIQIRQSVADAYGISINSSITDTSLGDGSSLASGSNIDVNGSKIILAKYTSNYLDADTGLTGQNKIEINNSAILIGLDVSTLTNGTTTSAFGGWTFNGQAGTLTFPDATVQTTAYNPNSIRSEGDINIEINLSDSTLRRWSFGEDGILTLPSVGKINNGAYDWTFGTDGKLTAPGNLQVDGGKIILNTGGNAYVESVDYGVNSANSAVNIFGGPYQKINLRAGFGTQATWTFGTDGNLTLPQSGKLTFSDTTVQSTAYDPSNIRSEGAINIDVNLSDSTLRRWQFGEDGNLTFPDGTNYSGSTITLPQTTNGTLNKVSWNFSDMAVGSTTTSLEWNLLSTTFSDFLIGTSSAATPFYFNFDGSGQTLGTIDNGGIFGGGKLTFGSTAGNNAGDVNAIELKASNGDVYLTSTESVKITVDASDSSARVWLFDPTGNLTFPDGTNQSTAYTGNAATVDITNTNGIDTNYSITFVENRDGAEILRADVDLTFNSWSNTLTAGNVTTGILKINDGVHEQFQAKVDATGVVTHDCSSGHIFRHTSPDANWTANFTNLNLDSTYATSVTLIIAQGATGYYPSAVQIAGSAQTINWQGNVNPTVSTSRTDVVTFSIINNAGTYTVLGQLTGF